MTLAHPKVEVEGTFHANGSDETVGHFTRWLFRAKNQWFVKHCVIEVADGWREKKIAWRHYQQALAFYRQIGVQRVDLDADNFGPYVWGDFGFQFMRADWERMMNALDATFGARYGERPPFYPSTATGLADFTGPDGEAIGQRVIREVHAGMGGSLKMNLDLADHATLETLYRVGLIERGST